MKHLFLLLPRKLSFHTTLTPAQCRRRLNRELVEYNRKPSLIATSSFIKKHRFESCYFGSVERDGSCEIFYHRAKKHDGSSAGFFGKIEKTEDGSLISGRLRRTAAVTVVALLWTITLLLLLLTLIAIGEYEGAACTAAVFAAGLFLIARDDSAQYIKDYLQTFEKSVDDDNSD